MPGSRVYHFCLGQSAFLLHCAGHTNKHVLLTKQSLHPDVVWVDQSHVLTPQCDLLGFWSHRLNSTDSLPQVLPAVLFQSLPAVQLHCSLQHCARSAGAQGRGGAVNFTEAARRVVSECASEIQSQPISVQALVWLQQCLQERQDSTDMHSTVNPAGFLRARAAAAAACKHR
jgi:hypothetical protein